MSCASLLAGFAMNAAEAGTDHSLAHALGAAHGLPHGLTVGLVLAESMEHDRRYEPELFERVADALGASPSGRRDGSRAVDAVHGLLAGIGFRTLRGSGVVEDDLDRLVELALAGWIPVEPGPWSARDVRDAYVRALAIGERRGE
jgi:alcohol dehydrogenase